MKKYFVPMAAIFAIGLASNASALLFDQNVTNDVIFGSGNSNGSFTVDQNNNVELGLRGKLRHNAVGAPENTYNSNGDGTYSFVAGSAFGQSASTAVWSFEWSINTDLSGTSGVDLADLTYRLGLDYNPSQGTAFVAFDPIHAFNPGEADGHWDHSIGDNSTGNGAGAEATDIAGYNALLDANNLAQQSWKAHWYIPFFNPNLDATYDIYLAAYDGNGGEVARTNIQIIVGNGGAPVPEPATMTLLGLGLAGLGVRFRKRKSA